jgi:hypothetical protein
MMSWSSSIAHFFGAAFVANALPHLMAGIAGKPLQTPFASPPFRGMSSPGVNVAWALANLAFAYFLLVCIGPLDLHRWSDAAIAFAGFGGMALLCSRSFARLRQERRG